LFWKYQSINMELKDIKSTKTSKIRYYNEINYGLICLELINYHIFASAFSRLNKKT
jgi:hypothetical protein